MNRALMSYPSPAAVEDADKEQLGRWYRFLPSPWSAALAAGKHGDEFDSACLAQSKTVARIVERFNELGGWTPEISKSIGWKP